MPGSASQPRGARSPGRSRGNDERVSGRRLPEVRSRSHPGAARAGSRRRAGRPRPHPAVPRGVAPPHASAAHRVRAVCRSHGSRSGSPKPRWRRGSSRSSSGSRSWRAPRRPRTLRASSISGSRRPGLTGRRGHPVGVWAGPGDGDGRRPRAALRLLGGDRQGARAGARRARARRPGRLAQPAGLRRHEPHLRRNQRPSATSITRSRGPTGSGSSSSAGRRPRPSSRSVSSRRRATSSASRGPAGRTSRAASRCLPAAWNGSRCARPAVRSGEPATEHRERPPPSSSGAPADRPARGPCASGTSVAPTAGWDGEWTIRDESFGAAWRGVGRVGARADDRVGRADHPHHLGSRPILLPGGAGALRRGAVRGDGDGPLRGGHDPTSSTVRGGS